MMRKLLALIVALLPLASGEAYAQQQPAFASISPADQAGVATTARAVGLAAIANQGGCLLRPQTSGRVNIFFDGEMVNGTAGDGARLNIIYGPAASAPANGAALPTGWTSVGVPIGYPATGTTVQEFNNYWMIGGLTPGVLYGFDLLVTIVTGGTETVSKVNCILVEE